jgi:hypothetical protein
MTRAKNSFDWPSKRRSAVNDLMVATAPAQLERRAFHPRTDVGWIGGFQRRFQPCSIEDA